MVRREITYKTENRNTIIYLLLHKNDFNNLNLNHITSWLNKQVKIVWFNIKNLLKLSQLFRASTKTFLKFWPLKYYNFIDDFLLKKRVSHHFKFSYKYLTTSNFLSNKSPSQILRRWLVCKKIWCGGLFVIKFEVVTCDLYARKFEMVKSILIILSCRTIELKFLSD